MNMNTLKKTAFLSIPLTFLFAAVGMLLQLSVESNPGSFYDKVKDKHSLIYSKECRVIGNIYE